MTSIGGINFCTGISQLETHAIGTLKIIGKSASDNPFEISNETFTQTLETPTLTIKQLSGQARLQMFGVTNDEIYRVCIRKPIVELKINSLVIVESNYLPTIKGTIKRVDYDALGLVVCYVNTSIVFPNV